MNSLQRIIAAVTFGTPDRVPVIPQLFAHSAVLAGHSILDYVESGEAAAGWQLDALRHYQADAVFAALDVCVEAEAVGGTVEFRRDIYPAVTRPPFTPDQDFSRLSVPDPATAGRMPEILAMARRLRSAVGDETLVVGVLQGPMTLTFQLLGPEQALYLSVDDPEQFDRLLDFATELAIRFGLAQLKAGVHLPMVFEPAGCPEVVPASFFRARLAPRLQRIFRAFRDAGGAANWLHIAGQTLPILADYPALGADIGNFDYCVEPIRLLKALPGGPLALDGNIKPLSFVESTPEEIEAESLRLINTFHPRGGFILSSGCEIPPEAKPENIAAMVGATRRTSCDEMGRILCR